MIESNFYGLLQKANISNVTYGSEHARANNLEIIETACATYFVAPVPESA